MSERFVTVGKLGRTRGVKGELYIVAKTDFPQRFLKMTEIHLRYKDQWEIIRLESVRMVSGRPVVKLEGIDTPEKAARLTNREVGVPEDRIEKLPEGSYWVHDLIGCRAVDEKTGEDIGEIVDVETYPASDVYTIRTDDGKDVVIAAVDNYVKSIDIVNKKVVVDRTGIVEP